MAVPFRFQEGGEPSAIGNPYGGIGKEMGGRIRIVAFRYYLCSVQKGRKRQLRIHKKYEEMATIQTLYLGDLRTEITHVQSGNKVMTDAPTDNNGKGEYISPTDMVAAALGSCMLTLMALAARRLEIELKGTRVEIQKVMAANPRRIAEIKLDFYFPGSYTDRCRRIIEGAGETCPVGKSLHPDVKQTVTYHYAEASSCEVK